MVQYQIKAPKSPAAQTLSAEAELSVAEIAEHVGVSEGHTAYVAGKAIAPSDWSLLVDEGQAVSFAPKSAGLSMHMTNISEAKANLSALIKLVQQTQKPVIIGKAGTPVAVLSAYNQDTAPRTLGSWKGKVVMADDFDETPEDVVNSFYDSAV